MAGIEGCGAWGWLEGVLWGALGGLWGPWGPLRERMRQCFGGYVGCFGWGDGVYEKLSGGALWHS